MALNKKDYRIYIFVFFVIFFGLISLYIPYKQSLVFVEMERNDVICFVPISEGDTFKIKFTHSIHLSDVIDSYQINEHNEIKQFELEYEDFGIGMPSEVSEGETFEMKDGKYFLRNMNRKFEFFDLRVGKVRANHTFVKGNVSFPLSQAIEPGTRVRIQVQKINLIQQMKGVNILEHKP